MGTVRIAIMAPAARLEPESAQRVTALAAATYGDAVELHFHPQCYLSSGHFAGDDAARAAAFLDCANDPSFDAVWFARGGYGSGRIAGAVLDRLDAPARTKMFLGYSDTGFLLAGLHHRGYRAVHGPLVQDIKRHDGETVTKRSLDFLVARDEATLEPTVLAGRPMAAFNIIILSCMIGTPLQPDLTDHVLMLEEVSEHYYAIDRALFHITGNPGIRKVGGLMLGRCSAIPENDPPYGENEEQIARHWCEVSGIPWLGRADIGHDGRNKIVPFGVWK